MRRLLLLLMIAVLPLRALAGDWMLVGMVANAATQGQSMAMPGCDMHLSHSGEQGSGSDQAFSGSDAQCGSCSLCYPVAQPTAFSHSLPFGIPESRPETGNVDFASAAATRNFRPPSH